MADLPVRKDNAAQLGGVPLKMGDAGRPTERHVAFHGQAQAPGGVGTEEIVVLWNLGQLGQDLTKRLDRSLQDEVGQAVAAVADWPLQIEGVAHLVEEGSEARNVGGVIGLVPFDRTGYRRPVDLAAACRKDDAEALKEG